MGTWTANAAEIDRKWFIVDANNKSLGRLATEVASILRGKHKPTFTPHTDTGDFVVVINAKNVTMTGNKWDAKKYYTHSRFFGSLKEMNAKEVREKSPTFMFEEAVQGMLPKNRLGRMMLKKLKVYEGAEHPHSTQKPEALNL